MTDYTLSDNIPSPAVLGGTLVYGQTLSDSVSSPAVLSGSLVWEYGIGDTIDSVAVLPCTLRDDAKLTAVVTSPASFFGFVRLAAYLSHVIASAALVTGGFAGDASISSVLTSQTEVTGFFKIVRSAASSKEASYEATGYRVSFPVLIYAQDTKVIQQIPTVPSNRSFLVAPDFIPTPGDLFSDNGAGPNYIGTKVVNPSTNVATLAFRAPLQNEVVWSVPDSKLYRFETNFVSGVSSWKLYRSAPQRFFDGQVVFSILDPDGIYDYLGQLLGAAQYEWSYDLDVLQQQNDPRACSHFFLAFLASQFGLTLDFSDPIEVRRAKTASAVPAFKFKGTEKGVEIRLRDLGYIGYARELWANPGDPTCSITDSAFGTSGNVALKASNQYTSIWGMDGGSAVTKAVGYVSFRTEVPPDSTDTLTVTDAAGLTKVFQFTATPSGGNIAVTPGSSPDDTMANLVTAINGSGLAVTAVHTTKVKTYGPPIRNQSVSSTFHGTRVAATDPAEFREYPHGYWSTEVPVYALTSRISVHVNLTDGSPLRYSESPGDIQAALALKQKIANDLQFDVLPAHIDIEFFATDRNVNGPGGSEGVTVGETFSVTHV